MANEAYTFNLVPSSWMSCGPVMFFSANSGMYFSSSKIISQWATFSTDHSVMDPDWNWLTGRRLDGFSYITALSKVSYMNIKL